MKVIIKELSLNNINKTKVSLGVISLCLCIKNEVIQVEEVITSNTLNRQKNMLRLYNRSRLQGWFLGESETGSSCYFLLIKKSPN